jgi:glycerophosphoryl diester phosphodiesterase
LPNGGFGLGGIHHWMHGETSSDKQTMNPVIIGHRGVWIGLRGGRGGAGNTIRAIREAAAIGVDWIEVDVRKSADGILFLFHDEDVCRVTDAKRAFANRQDWDFSSFESAEIAKLGIDYPNGREAIPRLADAMKEFAGDPQVKFVLDLKDSGITPRDLRKAVGELDPDRFILFGKKDCLDDFAEEEKASKDRRRYTLGYTALWTENNNKLDFLFSHEFLLRECKDLGGEYLVLPALFLNQDLIDNAHKANCKVLAYGIDEQYPYKVTDMGVDGLIVDDPSGVSSKY